MFNRKKVAIVSILVVVVIFLAYVIVGRQVPIHPSRMKVGSERIYYHQTSRLIQCDVAYTEVIVFDDGTYEYAYELINIGNGSCVSELYIWDSFKYYSLSEAIEEDIISLDDFLESDIVVKRLIISND